MSEGEQRTFLFQTVGPAIADIDPFFVFLIDNLSVSSPRAGIAACGMGTALVE